MRSVGCFLLFLCLLSSASAQQSSATSATVVPTLVNFTGVLTDASGKPLTSVVGITFSLYKDSEGGAPLWMETQNVQPDKAGHYSATLGSTTSGGLSSELFVSGEARWLGVQVQGQTEQPRILLLSVPYALKAKDAETLGGMPASAFVTTEAQTSSAQAGTSAAMGTSGPSTSAQPGQGVYRASAASSTSQSTASVGGTGTTNFIPRWTNSTTLGNSLFFQMGANVGLGTTTPTQKFEVDFGNLLVRGPNNFKSTGNTALLYVGDTNHPIEAIFEGGLAIGAYRHPEAIFIADFTGNVGIGTTKPTTGILNTVANTKSVIGLSVLGWNAPLNSNSSGTDALHSTGGRADTNGNGNGGAGAVLFGGSADVSGNSFTATGGDGAALTGGEGLNGGAGVVATGGAGGSFGLDAGGGGAGIVATGGNTLGDFGGGDGVVAKGVEGGTGVVATAGESIDSGSAPGVMATGGLSEQAQYGPIPNGPGLVGMGGSGSIDSDDNLGGDGIDAIAGTGCSGCANGLAGSFTGDVSISGSLTVGGTKHFKIDHPLDPANKYLYHAALESSEVLNLYSGNATLDASGEATVQLPDWFQALNRDFRYQLTAIGGAAPNLHIAQKIENNAFKIAGGSAGLEVSWQVTGVRQDAWEKAHPMVVEVQKTQRERGYYINPELYGAPPERNMDWARMPYVMKRLKNLQQKQAQERVNQKQARLTKPVKSTKP